ncbi:DNRLRE domain-containing protein [Streptomyces erythrochromogenes]|uniref:DNRLRE domain-containing protein n=1 Tax=Streptomyces erythrochromogenes TaxID=285574 RepID=UPI00369E04E0
MAITVLDISTAAAAVDKGQLAAQNTPKVTVAADIPSAHVAAKLSGQRVEALSERTETSTVWVNKDGSLTSEVSAGPVRFKDPTTGEWRDVDVTLASAPDGSVASKAHPRGLKLSGAANQSRKSGQAAPSLRSAQTAAATDLVTLGQGDEAITLQWRGSLPAPKLDGTLATYENAVNGANVVVEATRTGFEQFVEVKNRPEPGFSYTLPLRTKGLKAEQQPDGSVLFTDKKSNKTATMPAPVMWDASVDAASGEHTRRAKVDMKVVKTSGGIDLVITPDAGFLADPATKYPVTVDPSTSALGNLFDTYVQQGETVDWSNDTELDFGNPGTKNANGTFRTARSFITWNTAPVSDALISSAQLSLWNFHSGNTDCTAQPWEVWTSNGPTTASRWTNQPAMVTKMATSTQTKGNPGCGSQPDGWINADVTSLVQQWASNKWTSSSMGLRATDENNTKQWKRVNSANAASNVPKLTVTYNYRPRTGTKQEAGAPFFSYGGAYVVNSVTPTLRDTFIDANGDSVQGAYQIFDAATDTQVGDVLRSAFVPSGQAAPVTVPAGVLTSGKTYKFRSSPYDGTHYNLGWSAWKTFTVDTAAPSAPTGLTSTDYPADAWVKGAGQSGNFVVNPPGGNDHHWLEWSLDGATWTKVPTDGAPGTKTIAVAPPKDGTHTLQVRAVDKADNKSDAVSYTFHAGPGGFVQPVAGERTARRLSLVAEADGGKFNNVSFSWRRSEADPWVQIPAGHVTSGGTPLTAWPVPMTDGRNAPLVWNATDTVNPDGSAQIKADFTGPNSAAAATEPHTVVVDRNASGAATDEVGSGTVNLLTGDFALAGTDVSAFGLSVTRTASSRTPDKGAKQEGQASIFGKEWVSGTTAESEESQYANLRRISDTAVDVLDPDGNAVHFTANTAKNGWIPEPGSEDLTLTGSVSGNFTLSDTDGTVTEFTRIDPAASTWQVTSTLLNGLANTTTTVVSETVTVDGKKLARPKRVIAPTSAASAATCTATPTTKGCRSLEFAYADSTTATDLVFGNFAGQVREIRLWSTEPGATNATSKVVQTYLYDKNGRLRQAWNPQLSDGLKTEYAYDTAGRVTGLTPSGELPWSFTYGQAGNAATAGEGMLLKASRSGLKQGTNDVLEGTSVTSVVYDVPLNGAKAPHAMGAADVKAWGQIDAPTDAAAVFPGDSVPSSHSGDALTGSSYQRADITYMNVSGRSVNTAKPGGHIATTEHDRFGNSVRELSASNRSLALGVTAEDRAAQNDLGIAALSSAERAVLLSTSSVYDAAGHRELEEFGPLRRIELTADLKSGATVLAPAGTSATARTWTTNEYDAGRPTDGTAKVKDQPTKVTTGAQVREHPSVQGEPRVTQTEYDWAKGLPTKSVKDPGGLAITTSTEYDSQGRVTKQLLPGSNGTDAGTRVTTYWSATGTGACQGRPEWADQICSTGPAGTITGGGSHPNQIPTSTVEYSWWGTAAKTTETANGVTRTTTTTHDNAGRPTVVAVTGGVGQAVPTTTTEYDPASGRAVKVTSDTGGTIVKAFDKLGRQTSYTDADGGTTTTEYDLLNRTVKTADNSPSTAAYTYDHAVEPRGLATKITDSIAGAFQATYDADGSVSSEKLPGGYTLKVEEDTTGSPLKRTYTRDSDGTVVLSDTVAESIHGQVTQHAGWSGQSYGYDAIGRLTSVEDTADTICTKRTYTFDNRTNRTSLTSAAGTPGADCPLTGGTTTTHSYDSADRLLDSGYTYDAFGRSTTVPNSTVSYYASDMVHQQVTGSQRQTWQLDAAQRLRSWKTETGGGSSWTQTGSKVNHYDSDGDNPRWITEDAATGSLTRNVDSASGDLAATTSKTGDTVLQLTNIHGDVALQLPLDAGQAPVALDNDEYGNARTGQSATRYNWLGGKQRSSETLSGLMLMGVRLYNPTSGRFLSTDPVYGGGDNAYGYPGDPVNQFDLDGRFWGSIKKWVREQKRAHAGFDMAYSAARFSLGIASLRFGGPVIKGAARLRWRHARHPIRTFKYIRRSCNTWGRCALTGFALSRSSSTYWHGRNTYRHANRFTSNFYGRMLNSMSPTARYRPRKWRGYF